MSRAAPLPHVSERKTQHQEVPHDLKDKVMPFWFLPFFFILYILCILYTWGFFLCGRTLVVTKTNLSLPKPLSALCIQQREGPNPPTNTPQLTVSPLRLFTQHSPHTQQEIKQNLGEVQSPDCPEILLLLLHHLLLFQETSPYLSGF